ncbi:putative urea active transporter [Clavispora lusitaniae]|uniref:Urea active transporter n=1 Tax=Clavispora lusitaniae TaxID=36911 RepID=A0ACD0WMX6_CLALS|nr:putative urea active transporter [Clavispora lusitaniae]QFZ34555.1 putative urea active transporter [Clavispora lusitaniae]QFZ40240.1 putative urea active transporter [Clavispora lusitaniae]QFZ45920.1 putative urea active transporter [Clavispora lusitaniae]QFZ51582.1 putative urea active transporter [Clavispora lusitaniae]
MGCGILATYAQIGNISGLHGLMVYTLSGAIPIVGFAIMGPMIRKKCPDGFIMTEWVRRRFGIVTALYVSFFTCLTMFLFMIGEVSAVKSAIETLTGLNGLGAVIVECVVTTIYTAFGGFRVSFITDNFQGVLVVLLVVICAAGMGSYIDIDTSKIGPSHLLDANKLGWQLLYILPVAIITNDCFMAGFWLRTFASKTDRDLWIGAGIASFVTFAICTLVGTTGFLAVWAGYIDVNDSKGRGANAFFIMLSHMPRWLIAFVLIFVICLSTCTFDSLQSAMVSTISNDVFRNKLDMIYVRAMVFIVMVPVVVLGVKVADNILQIYLIADLVSAAVIPALFLGLSDRFFWFLRGFDIMVGGLSALFAVFVFGWIYYDSAREGGKLLLVWNGIYDPNDWGGFGAFVIAPFGGLIFTFMACGLRAVYEFVLAKKNGTEFTTFDRVPIVEREPISEDYGAMDDSSDKKDSEA